MDIRFTTNGHYSIIISKCCETLNKFSEENYDSVLLSIDDIALETQNKIRKIAEKLHRQFGHSSTSEILKLVKASEIEDNKRFELTDEMGEDCSTSLKYKKAPLKPVVGLPLSKHFDDAVSMDLKEINDHKILHMVDHFTWFSSAAVVKSKHKEEIVKATFQHWIVLGQPNQTLSDN